MINDLQKIIIRDLANDRRLEARESYQESLGEAINDLQQGKLSLESWSMIVGAFESDQ